MPPPRVTEGQFTTSVIVVVAVTMTSIEGTRAVVVTPVTPIHEHALE